MNDDLGKFVRRTGGVCPDCDRHTLELRMYGEKEKLVCACGYEEYVQAKRIRRIEEIEEPIPDVRRNFRPVARRA